MPSLRAAATRGDGRHSLARGAMTDGHGPDIMLFWPFVFRDLARSVGCRRVEKMKKLRAPT